MADRTLDLRRLKCPLPVLHARKALAGMQAGELLVVDCTDPMALIDIPVLVRHSADVLEAMETTGDVTRFRIRKGRAMPGKHSLAPDPPAC